MSRTLCLSQLMCICVYRFAPHIDNQTEICTLGEPGRLSRCSVQFLISAQVIISGP